MADTKQIDWGDGTGEKITVIAASFVGNKGLQISSPENVKITPRSKTIVLKSKKDPTKVARINVTQEKAVYTYDFYLTASAATLAAKGGTSIITAWLKTYRNGNLVSTETVIPVLSGSATGFYLFDATVDAQDRGTVVGAERSIAVTGKYSGTYDGQEVSATVVVKQEANAVVSSVSTVNIRLGSGPGSSELNPIPASGGRIQYAADGNTRVTYTSGSYVDNGFTPKITGAAEGFTVDQPSAADWWISANNRGTVVGGARSVTVTASANGATSKSVTVYQQANSATYGNLVGGSASASDIPASGGTRTATVVNATQTVSFTSGSTRAGTVTYTQSDAISGSSLGTTLKSRTKLGTIEVVFTGEGGRKSSTSCDVYQQANTRTAVSSSGGVITYGGISAGKITNATIPASGGTGKATAGNTTQSWSKSAVITTYEYTSGSRKDEETTPASSGSNTVTPSVASIEATASSKGTTVSAQNVVKQQAVTWSANGKSASGTMYIYQAANEATSITYGVPVVTLSVSDIPASGGTVSSGTVTYSQSRTQNYTSGATSALSALTTGGSISYSSAVSASSLGTIAMARTAVGTLTATVSMNGKSGSKEVDVYQQANRIDSYNYGSWNIVISASPTTIAYGGGTSKISASCARSKTPVYTSGATGTVGTESATPTLSGSATGFTLSGTTVTASVNSWAASRSIVVTASYSGATSKSVTITQSAAPASLSLNKTTIAFPQRASSNTVQVTCNSDWAINSNVEFVIPDTLEIKYNPNTDIVELVDQPYQIIKKVQESNDYALALVRIGAFSCSTFLDNRTKAPNREKIRDEKNIAGYVNRNQLFLLTKTQDKRYHRIVGRQWFRDGNAVSQIAQGRDGQAKLYTADMLITKPGKVVGIRGCELSVPLLKLAEEDTGNVRPASSVSWNKKTGRITFTTGGEVNERSMSQPRMPMVAQTSNNGPLGYILFKKKSTTQYLDVHGWEEVSNFTLARVLIDTNFTVKQLGSQFAVTVVFQYGED